MVKRYEIDQGIERATVAFSVLDKRFFGALGYAIDVEMLPSENARLVMQVVQGHHRDTKGAGCSPRIVAQRLRALRTSGRLTLEDATGAVDWLMDSIASNVTDRDGVLQQMAVIVRHHIHGDVVRRAMELHGKRADDFSEVRKLLESAERLGKVVVHDELCSDDEGLLDKISDGTEDRLPTGIEELDEALGGGLARGEFGFAIGSSGDGKSMMLSQVTASALFSRKNVFVATLELSPRRWAARLLGAMADVPVRTILDRAYSNEQKERLNEVQRLALFDVKGFTPGVTRCHELWEAFDAENERLSEKGDKRQYEVLVCDYADRLGLPKGVLAYEGALDQYEPLRLGADQRGAWSWTASQSVRVEEPTASKKGVKREKRLLGLNDGADSQHKVRVADVVVTLNSSEDKKLTRVSLVKNRNGESGHVTSQLDTEFAFGRLTNGNWIAPKKAASTPTQAPESVAGLSADW